MMFDVKKEMDSFIKNIVLGENRVRVDAVRRDSDTMIVEISVPIPVTFRKVADDNPHALLTRAIWSMHDGNTDGLYQLLRKNPSIKRRLMSLDKRVRRNMFVNGWVYTPNGIDAMTESLS